MPLVSLPGWTWFQAGEIAFSGMLTALIIMSLMVILLRLLQIIASRVEEKNNTKIDMESAPTAETDKMSIDEPVSNQKVIAAISAAVYQYVEEQDPVINAGRTVITRQPAEEAGGSSWRAAGRKQLLEIRTELEQMRRNKQREKV